jgi:UPF0716 family protein affecting phage T7 exclusion
VTRIPPELGLGERARNLSALTAAIAVPLGIAAALVPVRGNIPNATVALILAALVSLMAAIGTRATAVVAAISASLGFDLFHTKPYGSLTISHAQDIETTVLLLIVSLVVGQLAARNRGHRRLAAATSYDLGRVHAVAEMVASGEPVDQVLVAVANELTDLLGLRSCRFDPHFAERAGPFIERHGALTWGALRWGFNTTGLPSHEVSLIVQYQGRPIGRYVLLAVPGTRVSADQLVAAVALADQAGAAVGAQGIPG